jgi:hypothetical protein
MIDKITFTPNGNKSGGLIGFAEFVPLLFIIFLFLSAYGIGQFTGVFEKDRIRDAKKNFHFFPGVVYREETNGFVKDEHMQRFALPVKQDWFIQDGCSILVLENGWLVKDRFSRNITFVPKSVSNE